MRKIILGIFLISFGCNNNSGRKIEQTNNYPDTQNVTLKHTKDKVKMKNDDNTKMDIDPRFGARMRRRKRALPSCAM